ncbi:iron-sulfur cluster assembly 1 homolog, mitochondrial-like [Varroa jacobsoni]|uniref:Iron-sulfur cluster assembly 1 homolog, mitochondrial n=1 Tax=Varroa destructor TaxID=109461 RepID=A0A7M7KNJ8_VARDE|nr:iron-sulfur cluster assembly 1 homolog, mitochondrial-like [Varroa destructor]XP_022703974.1 iron-sulfur cluster assembly 1 homolog, mitochondrial-like [Varroa jacobsoni]XP_022703975.1 iron-sulfur cluster assembly 1 homolog, mitochondrial-like [Varroa jacobsoni]XP_022703976.1 iron-sulfur cluster assembly 1 homolog, mitochondrial-like [Varroa jacobsoni]XP_022703977.1 iron-sulfur cluster assembly 1 homolog, mitochondrial-like [Varroa jacobsoni]
MPRLGALLRASVKITTSIRPTSKPLRPTRAALTLTPAAVSRVKELLAKEPDAIGLKIGLKQRGCSGMSYVIEFAKQKAKFDEEVKQDGVRILIDARAQLSLLGTEMDFVESKIASEFIFHNPNAKGTCGCGESFTV